LKENQTEINKSIDVVLSGDMIPSSMAFF